MKIYTTFLYFHLLYILVHTQLTNNNDFKIISSNDNIDTSNNSIKPHKDENNNKNRDLASTDGFSEIRIFIDKTYINTQKAENANNFDKVINAIDKCVNTIKKLIKVKPMDKIKFSDSDLLSLEIGSNNIDQNLCNTCPGINADLVVIPKFIDNDSIIAKGKPLILHPNTKRPIGAILLINKVLPRTENNQYYLESIFLHQFTHILGFTYEMFEKFPGSINKVIKTETEKRTNFEKKFVITTGVVDFAKKYFNCDSITGVELEDGGGDDGYVNSHWEARILLGEYMNSKIHTPEQAISGFTLALLEDSGWYKTNKYTGGLMRFGKNQGCDFLFKDCEVSDSSKNKFKNDLFTGHTSDSFRATCTSGRQSRSYNVANTIPYRKIQISGKDIADYCFVSDYYYIEEQKMLYVGSCNKGGGEYGSRIFYNDNVKLSKNGEIPEIFGEEISSNSFCVFSSVIPSLKKSENINKYDYYIGINHPMCYPMFCSKKSLTIKIYNQYIVCPRSGGIVQINGDYQGYVYCPDYNLICTGTVLCNDMFECVEKESLEKTDSYNYEYEAKTTQYTIEENQLTESDISIGFELSNEDDTKCPEHCSQCKENRKCIICEDNYKLVGSKENDNNPIVCSSETQSLPNYYKNETDNTFYLCMDNCLACSSKDKCDNCDLKYKLNADKTNCDEKIPHCNFFDSTYTYCIECYKPYYLLSGDNLQCHNETIDKDEYFTEDDEKTFTKCEDVIENCIKCTGRNSCTQCINTHKVEQNGAKCNPKIPHCKTYDANFEYCLECEENYYLLNDDKTHCYNDPIDNERYISEDDGKKYISCDHFIPNCDKCQDRETCIACKEGYILEEDSKTCSIINDPNASCDFKVNNIDDKDITFLQENNINYLVQQYTQNSLNNGKVEHYVNNKYNYTITIFKIDECTKNLLSIGDYYLKTKNILALYNRGYFISCFISYNLKNYMTFYKNTGEKIDMEDKCPECLRLNFKISNNFTKEFLEYYSPLIVEKIKEGNIDVFSKENEILNDKCNSFEVGGINMPLEVREKIYYNNVNYEGIICTDINCIINSKNMEELTSDCDCKINNELNYLFTNVAPNNNNNEQTNDGEESKSDTNIFSCLFKSLTSDKLAQNFAFYFSLSCAIIEIISFALYAPFKQEVNLEKYSKDKDSDQKSENLDDKKTNQVDTPEKGNNATTEDNKQNFSFEGISNPPPKNSILYKYRWFKNKPKILSLENSHDEDLDVQSRDEADPENEMRRKIKKFSFLEKPRSEDTSEIDDDDDDDEISDNGDKKTETSKNKITLVNEDKSKKIFDKYEEKKDMEEKKYEEPKNIVDDIEIQDISPKKEQFETLKINLPPVLSREQNARKRRKHHSIKNQTTKPTKESTYPIKAAEEKNIKKPMEIYIDVLCIKQHIINFFSCYFNKCLEKESFIPLQMKIIRFIFLIILNMFFNSVFIGEKYFVEKYNYFNEKYNLQQSADKDFKISTGEKIGYSFSHGFINALKSFIICLIFQFFLGFIFFGTKKKVDYLIERKKDKEKPFDFGEYNTTMSKIKSLFITFFIINFVLLIILSSYLIGFNMVYKGSESDFLIPTLVTFILLQILPFIISIIITLLWYNGLKKENKTLVNIAKTFLF